MGGYVIQRGCSTLLKLALVAVVLGVPSTAAAELIGFTGQTNFTGTGHGAAVSTTLSGVGSYSGFAGELNWLWGSDGNPATIAATPDGFAQAFYTYCVDMSQYLQDPQTVNVISSDDFMGGDAGSGARAAWLFNSYASAIRSNTYADSNLRAAALQVAIWEAVYDSTGNLGGGDFTLATTGSIRSYADSYITALYSVDWSSSNALILNTSDERVAGQDQVTNIAVPEPATFALVGLGWCFVSSTKRRRRVRRHHEVL
jgi:hypothetical protein